MKRYLASVLLLCFIGALFFGCAREAEPEASGLPARDTATYAVLVGTISEKIIDEQYPNATKLPFDSIHDAVLALLSGKADYVLTAYTNCLNFMRANPEKLAVLPDRLSNEPAAIAVNKEETELRDDLDRVLEQFREDGTLARILSNWIREDGSDYVREEIPVRSDGAVLPVAVSAEREPMCFVENGEIVGLDAELIQRIAYELGMRVEFHDMKFSALIPSVLSGITPVATSNMTATDERRESVDFTAEYYINPQTLLTRAEFLSAPEAKAGYDSLNELNGKRIGVTTGSVFDAVARAQWPDAELMYFDSDANLVIALQQEKIDALINDLPVARTIVKSIPSFKILDELLAPDQYGIAFRKTEEGEKLRDALNDFMRTAEDGALLALLDDIWFGTDDAKKTVEAADALPAVNGVIRLASPMETPPFSYEQNGRPAGMEIDLITRFCKAMGYGLELETVSFGALLPGLVSGRYDMVASSVSITEERAQSVLFSDPVYTGGVVAVVLTGTEVGEDGLRSYEDVVNWFPGKRMGLYAGATMTEPVASMIAESEHKWLNSYADMAAAVNAGQIDGFLCEEPLAPFVCASSKGLYNTGILLNEENYSCVFSRKNAALCDALNRTIARLSADGTLARMKEKWGSQDTSLHVMPDIKLTGENGTLRVATSNDAAPFGYLRDNEYVGYDFELLAYFAEENGYALEYDLIDWAATTAAVSSGKYDLGVGCMVATAEREDAVLFSDPIYYSGVVLITADRYAPKAQVSAEEEEGFFDALAHSFQKNFMVENRWKLIVSGIGITLLLSVCSGIAGILIGFGFCLMRMSRFRALSATASAITRVLQGTPMVVLLMILYYVVFNKSGLDGVAVSIIAFGLNFGAYASEIMLSGIHAVDNGQREAAAAIGFSPAQTFIKIVFPQAARHFLPVLKGEYISLVKMTSIVGYVAVQDLTKVSDIIRSRTYEAFFPLIVTAIIYFLLSFGLSSLLRLIEVRIDPKHRPRALKGVKLS